jgi:hypothetical protein
MLFSPPFWEVAGEQHLLLPEKRRRSHC